MPRDVFFLDNCIPIRLAQILQLAEFSAHHLQDLWPDSENPDGVPDEVWIPEIGKRDWVVISGDQGLTTKQGQVVALKKERLITYVAYKGFTNQMIPEQVRWMFRSWERIENHVKNAQPGHIYEVRSDGKIEEKHLRGVKRDRE